MSGKLGYRRSSSDAALSGGASGDGGGNDDADDSEWSVALNRVLTQPAVDAEVALVLDERLAKGAYGTVFRAHARNSATEAVAVKVVSRSDSSSSGGLIEVEILQRVGQHPNLVRLRGVYACARTGDLWLSLELMTGGSVAALIDALSEPLSEPEIVTVCRDVLNALAWLHQSGVIHRDIKAGNIMLARDTAAVKLIDFGVSAFCSPGAQRQTVIGTPLFMAPEMIDNTGMPSPYDEKVDIWALGVTLIELAQMRPPHHDVNPMRAIFLIPVAPPPLLAEPDRWSADFVRVQRACVRKDPQTRPVAADLLRDVWLGGKQRRVTSLAEPLANSAILRGAASDDNSNEALDNAGTAPGRSALLARLQRVSVLNASKPAMTRAQQIAAALAELDDETESEHLDVSSSSDSDNDDDAAAAPAAAAGTSAAASVASSAKAAAAAVAASSSNSASGGDADGAAPLRSLPAAAAAKFRVGASPASTRRKAFIGLRRNNAADSAASSTAVPTVTRASSGAPAPLKAHQQLQLPTQHGSDRQVPMPPLEHLVLSADEVIVPRLVERQLVQKHLLRLRKLQASHEKELEKLRRAELFDIEQKHAKYLGNVAHVAKDAQANQAKLVALQATRRAERARQNEVERKALQRRSVSTSSEHLSQVKARQRAERKSSRGDATVIDGELIDGGAVDIARLSKSLLRLALEQRHEIELARVRQRAAVRDLAALHRMQVDDAQRATTFAAHDLAEQHHAALATLAQLGDTASEHHAAALALQQHHLVLRQRLLQSQMLQRQALERQQQQEFVTVSVHAARKAADARRKVASKRIKEARKDAVTKQEKARLALMEEEHEALLRAIDADYHEALRRAQPVLDDLSSFHFYQQRRLTEGMALRRQSLLVALNRYEFAYQLAKHTLHYRLRASQLHEREQLWRNAAQGELSLTDALYERRRELVARSSADEETLVQQLAAVRRDTAAREQCDAALVAALGDAAYGLQAVRNAVAAEQAALAEVHHRERATLQSDTSKKIALAGTEIESLERERLKTRADLLLAHGDDAKRLRGGRIAVRRALISDDVAGPLAAATTEAAAPVPPAVLDALVRAAQADDVEQVLAVARAHAPTAPATVLRAVDVDGCGLLHHAVHSGGLAVLRRFASPSPATALDAVRQCCALEVADRHFITPALLAAKVGALGALGALLDLGAETRATSEDGNTIMHYLACISGGGSAVQQYGEVLTSVIPLCKLSARNRAGDTALHVAATNRQDTCVRALVAAHVDVNTRNVFADTPLHNAVRAGDVGIVRLLLDAGALPTVEGMNGDALQVAQMASPVSAPIVELLAALPALQAQRAAAKRLEPCSMLLDDAVQRYTSPDASQFFALQTRQSSSPTAARSPTSPRSPRSPRTKKSPEATLKLPAVQDLSARQLDRGLSFDSRVRAEHTAASTPSLSSLSPVRVLLLEGDGLNDAEDVAAADDDDDDNSDTSVSSTSTSGTSDATASLSDSTSASQEPPKAPNSVSPGAQHYEGRRVRVMAHMPTLATIREESPSPPPPPARLSHGGGN